MIKSWNEDPGERPSFGDIEKLLDNRMSDIAGYLDVGYNPFIFTDYESLDHPEYSTIEELPPTATSARLEADSQQVAEAAERKKPQIKPRTKKPTIHITDDINKNCNSVADSGHYY
jgi:hypothetical protein